MGKSDADHLFRVVNCWSQFQLIDWRAGLILDKFIHRGHCNSTPVDQCLQILGSSGDVYHVTTFELDAEAYLIVLLELTESHSVRQSKSDSKMG